MKTRLTLICITLFITFASTTNLFAQRVPQGHLSTSKEPKRGIPSIDSGIRVFGAVKYSPDGKVFAVLEGIRRDFKLYDAEYGKELKNSARPQGVICFAFSPDSKLLATGRYGSNLSVWYVGDVDSGIGLQLWYNISNSKYGHKSTITCIEFSPDGKQIATGSLDKTICVWDVASAKHLLTIKGGMKAVSSIAYSPDGSMIATGSLGKAFLWDAKTGGRLTAFDQRGAMRTQTPTVTTLTFSPDGKTLITGNSRGAVHSWRVDTGEHLRRIVNNLSRSHFYSSVNKLTFSPDGNTLAGLSSDSKIYLWDMNMQKEPKILEGLGWNDIAFSPDGNTIGIVGIANIRFWDVNTNNYFGLKDIRTRYEIEDR